ncbi:MAG: phenylalanine--tRNA ligase subunit alpha [Bacteroidota bacterium]
MNEKIVIHLTEIDDFPITSASELENFRIYFLGKKGVITALFAAMKEIPNEEKKAYGQDINLLKNKAEEKIESFKTVFEKNQNSGSTSIDTSMPIELNSGSRHPISVVQNRIYSIFEKIGFTVALGPEIEDDWHVFSALNFPEEHPARDMQDTFFIESNPDVVLRTHTSSIQVRIMETTKPPIRVICPGRVFRNEAITARAHCIFHQVEGLYIDKNVTFADLKQTLLYFAQEMFGKETKIRLRPSYFPFTEPSAEMDISCDICGGKGCNICKNSGWVEILGCGMVDPAVLESCGIDSTVYTGYAFGLGIERMTQQVFKTKDIRMFFENDLRFIKQFESAF